MKKKLLSFLLALTFIVSAIPFGYMTAYAKTDDIPTVYVESIYAASGSETDVHVKIKDNSGIAGAIITVTYDPKLMLTEAESGEAFATLDYTRPGTYSSPCNFTWDSESAVTTEDGIILTLSFKVSALAEANDILPIGISYRHGDIYDGDLNSVTVNLVSGNIAVINYIPGDVNDDGVVNGKDVTLIRRYNAGGYDVSINEATADVNDDGVINGKDVTLIRRYNAGGYDVELKPSTPKCSHNMEHFAAKDATCTEAGNNEYWRCTLCGKYFNNANGSTEISVENIVIPALGHTPETIAAVPATTTSEGYTEGVWCDVCKTWLSGHERIKPIEENESIITYHLWYVEQKTNNGTTVLAEDNYLKQQTIANPNGNTYVEGVGIPELVPPTAEGYDFIGWFERPEVTANRIYSISAEERGNKSIYAVWSKHEYTITYLPASADSTLPKIPDEKFTVDKETALQVPSWPNLVWVGWSNEEGEIVKSIPKGTAHDVSLTANWMSKRNQTVPNTNYASSIPAIVEEDGIIAFVYEIGDIQNVPIQQVIPGAEGVYNLVKGQEVSITKEFTQVITEEEAVKVSDVIANSTVKSDSWTLSENWNESTSFSKEHENEVTQEQMQKAQQSFSQTNKYTLSSGIGGTVEHIDENGKSSKVTKYQEFGVNAKVGINAGLEAKVKKVPIVGVGGSVNGSVSGELGLNYKNGRETVDENYEKHTDKTSLTWNTNQGFETSATCSASQEFSQKLGQSVKDTYKYGEVLDFGGSNSKTASSSNTSSTSRESSSSVAYRTESGSKINVNETLTADAETGFYRKMLAANFRVFAVVVYDIEARTFSTMTYSLKINGSEHLFTDYSTVSSFNDYENGVLPFSVPTFVGDYVYSIVGASDGLRIDDETGIIERYGYKDQAGVCHKSYNEDTQTYSEELCDTDVVLPKYMVVNNKIVEVKGFSASAFSGTTITSIHLNAGITEIPNSAFENCSQLHYLTGPSITKIGSNAFKNCTSLCEMSLSPQITELGIGAFDGDDGVTVYASSPEIAKTAMTFNVDYLTIDLSYMTGSLDNETLKTPDNLTYFGLNGGGKTFNNLSIESDATTTEITNITINSNASNPLKTSSANLSLGYAKISAAGIALNLTNDSTAITLNGNNYVESSSANATLSKSIKLIEKEGSSSIGKMRIKGNALVLGEVKGAQFASFDTAEHTFKYLTQQEYDRYFTSLQVQFDSNGGDAVSSITVYYGEKYGNLPVPTREHFTFEGWYTAIDGGEIVTQDDTVLITGDITLYAHWSPNAYSATWNTGTGYSISVSRSSSPYAGANIGTILSGETVYYGDILSIVYTPSTGYSLNTCGNTSITVTSNITSQDIYAVATPNTYTYNIAYISSNGTDLGTSTATYQFGTTNTISAIEIPGYDMPETQDVLWDSTEAKTITFVYTPTSVGTQTIKDNAWWWKYNSTRGIKYSLKVSYSERTADSVKITISWTNTISSGLYYGYAQYFNMTIGGVSTGKQTIASSSKWSSSPSKDDSVTKTVTITVTGLSANTTSVSYSVDPSASGGASCPDSFSGTLTIPTY